MEIKGKVIAKPAAKSGVSGNGPWRKEFLVIRYEDGHYPKDIMLSNMKKSEDFGKIKVGDYGTFKFDATSRSGANGMWYCDLTCWSWNIENINQSQGPI